MEEAISEDASLFKLGERASRAMERRAGTKGVCGRMSNKKKLA